MIIKKFDFVHYRWLLLPVQRKTKTNALRRYTLKTQTQMMMFFTSVPWIFHKKPSNHHPTSVTTIFLTFVWWKYVKEGYRRVGDDNNQPGVNDVEHGHIPEANDGEIGVEFRVHDPNQLWSETRLELGECYESPAQLRFALTNHVVHNGYGIYFEKSDRLRVIARRGNNSSDKKPCPFRVATAWNYKFGSLVTSNWLAKHYLQDVIRNLKMTLDEMK